MVALINPPYLIRPPGPPAMPPIPKKHIPQKTSKKVTFEKLDHTQTGVEASRFVSICMRTAGCTSVGMVIIFIMVTRLNTFSKVWVFKLLNNIYLFKSLCIKYLLCERNLPVECPEPSQPGMGHLQVIYIWSWDAFLIVFSSHTVSFVFIIYIIQKLQSTEIQLVSFIHCSVQKAPARSCWWNKFQQSAKKRGSQGDCVGHIM